MTKSKCEKKKSIRAKNLKKRYGISVEQYEQMLINQNYRCKICGSTDPGHKKKHFSVDHCHRTKKVRGLLCTSCNLALGYLKDDVTLLKSCIDYFQSS